MFIIAGLGNPGQQYQKHRHNVGFMAIDEIANQYSTTGWQNKFNSFITNVTLPNCNNNKILLVKPQTYMNNSGQAIGEILRYYKLTTKELLVIYDDLALPFAKIRVKDGGGSGGHNGIKSIDQHCGANYKRLKIGIDHPGDRNLVHNYVLNDFSKNEFQTLDNLLADIAKYIDMLISNESSQFMNKLIT